MQRTPEGRYLVICQGERNVETPDTPFQGFQRVQGSIEQERRVSAELYLAGD